MPYVRKERGSFLGKWVKSGFKLCIWIFILVYGFQCVQYLVNNRGFSPKRTTTSKQATDVKQPVVNTGIGARPSPIGRDPNRVLRPVEAASNYKPAERLKFGRVPLRNPRQTPQTPSPIVLPQTEQVQHKIDALRSTVDTVAPPGSMPQQKFGRILRRIETISRTVENPRTKLLRVA